jgi:hypothetical protein
MGGKPGSCGSEGTTGADDREVTQAVLSQDSSGEPQRAGPVSPRPYKATEIAAPAPPTEVLPQPRAAGVEPPTVTGIVRYGPGVPVVLPDNHGGSTAEHVWRGSPAAGRRPRRLRGLAGWALTVILLAAAGIVFYLRFYHAPLHVTGAVIAQRSPGRCDVKVTGRITTNGGSGTVAYEWLFRPGGQQPTPLNQAVAAGQDEVTVVAAISGSGQGRAAQTVTLQVLSPGRTSASANVVVSC